MSAINHFKVSICIPAYNQTKYLKILLNSIEEQTFNDFEIIITDDSTTDDVSILVSEYNFGSKLKYFKNPQPLGSPANWNAAIEKATGKYVKIMHHDDAFAVHTSLSEMISHIEANNFDYIFCNTKIENIKDPDRNRVHKIRRLHRTIRKPYLLFLGNSVGAPSTLLLKRELCSELRYDTRYIWLVDIEYYARLFKKNSSGSYVQKPLIITHEGLEQRLTTGILADFELQIKEEILLYNSLVPHAPKISRFFMQVRLTRFFFRSKTRRKELLKNFKRPVRLLQIFFSVLNFKAAYFAYFIFIRFFDLARKVFYYLT